MAEPDFTATPTFRTVAPKPKMTVYYALLIVAFVCVLAACLVMYMEVRRFRTENGNQPVPARISAVERGAVMARLEAERMTNDQAPMSKI